MPMARPSTKNAVSSGSKPPPPKAALVKARDHAKAAAAAASAAAAKGKGAIGISLKAAEVVGDAERGRLDYVSLMYSQERGGIAISFSRTDRTRQKVLVDGSWNYDILTLGGTRVGSTLCDAMRLETLREIELVGLKLPTELFRMLGKAMEKNSSLQSVCLNDSEVGDKNLALLLPGIKDHPTLSRLQLCNTSITDVGGRELMETLRQQAERLSLASWQQTLRTSVSKTEKQVGVKVVALSYNGLGQASLSLLSSVVSLDSPLREVYMKGCSATPTISGLLQDSIVSNSRLETLDVRDLSGAPGWIWDVTQTPPLIMQDFLPRPDVRVLKQERPDHGLPQRYVFGTASARASSDKDKTRGMAAPNRRDHIPLSNSNGLAEGHVGRSYEHDEDEAAHDARNQDSVHRAEVYQDSHESALDPLPSWTWDAKQHKAELKHRVHIEPNPKARLKATRGLFKGKLVDQVQRPVGKKAGGIMIGAADEEARQHEILEIAAQLEGLVRHVDMHDDLDDAGSTARGQVQRTTSVGDMLGQWADHTHTQRPLRESHRLADALLDPAIDTVSSSKNAEERGHVNVVASVKNVIRRELLLRLRAEARALSASLENASLRRRIREMASRAPAHAAPVLDSGEEERLLLELEETIYLLSNKVRGLEEGEMLSDLPGNTTASSLGRHTLVVDRLKQMWDSKGV